MVDDDPDVLETVATILERARFNVLRAGNGQAAVHVAQEYKGAIDLLLSDWDMPGLSGPALGLLLKVERPDIHVMLMSGRGRDGTLLVLNYGWAILEKPSMIYTLVRMVNDVLLSPNRSQLGGHEYDLRKDAESP